MISSGNRPRPNHSTRLCVQRISVSGQFSSRGGNRCWDGGQSHAFFVHATAHIVDHDREYGRTSVQRCQHPQSGQIHQPDRVGDRELGLKSTRRQNRLQGRLSRRACFDKLECGFHKLAGCSEGVAQADQDRRMASTLSAVRSICKQNSSHQGTSRSECSDSVPVEKIREICPPVPPGAKPIPKFQIAPPPVAWPLYATGFTA